MNTGALRALGILFIGLGMAAGGVAQDSGAQAADAPKASPAPASQPKSPSQRRLAPVFPLTPPGFAWVEGEDAVSTNMTSAPTLNYGCSAGRALQLSRPGRLLGGASYYADYAVYVDEAGSYELWYGGTPPGPRDEFAPSFASPIEVVVDGGAPRPVFRESMNVVEEYAPAYYWNRCYALELSKGAHVLRFEVKAKRRLDDRFFFYIDAFFLATKELLKDAATNRTGLPARFPKNPAERGNDHPFRSFEEYQALIQANPANVALSVELANEYSLAADYPNALRFLSRAAVIAPSDARVRLLIAKNRIWHGDVKEGLDAYGIYLSLRSDDLGAWQEAGKVAAWSGRYSDSEYFYVQGLKVFPDNASLSVNMGLTLLWAGRVGDAERTLAAAEKKALADPAAAEALAEVYRDNGLPERAVATYEKAIATWPERLGFYLAEGAILAAEGKDEAERALEARIVSSFEFSPELDAILESAKARRELKAGRIADLESRIAAEPGNLELRDELTRVYAWAGRKAEAARQLESILAARFAASLASADGEIAGVYVAQFSAAVLLEEEKARLALLSGQRSKALAAQSTAIKALADLRSVDKTESAAAAAAATAAAAAAAAAAQKTAGQGAQQSSTQQAAPAPQSSAADLPPPAAPPEIPVGAAADSASPVLAPASSPVPTRSAQREAAELALRNALAAQVVAIDTLRSESLRVAHIGKRAAALQAGFESAVASDLGKEKAFKAVIAGIGWNFDPAGAAAEMNVSAARGEEISSLARGRLLLPKDPQTSQSLLGTISSSALAEGKALLESLLMVRRDPRSLYRVAASAAMAPAAPGSLASLLPSIAAASGELAQVNAIVGEGDSALDLPAESTDLEGFAASASVLDAGLGSALAAEAELRKAAAAVQSSLVNLVRQASAFEDRRLARAWHSFESTSLDLRDELGSYYDSLGMSALATRQYRRVLALDPGNLRSMYSLALAEDKSGDWAAATSLYKSVNAADPSYGSAAALHNALAKSHATTYGNESTAIADMNFLDFSSASNLAIPLGSFLVLKPRVDLRLIRDRAAGTPAFFVVDSGFEAQLRLGGAGSSPGLVIKPSASLIGTSADFSAFGSATVIPAEFFRALSLYSGAGLTLDLGASGWKASLAYKYEPLPGSVNPSSLVLFAHSLDFSGSAYIPLSGAFRFFAPRFSLSGAYVPGDLGNLYGTALVEVVPALKLSDSPWASLAFPIDVVVEAATWARTTPYYATTGSLTAKAGLLWQSSWTARQGGSFSVGLEGMGGIYLSDAFSGASTDSLYLSALCRLDVSRGSAEYWLTVEAAATDPFAAIPKYWSLSLIGGSTIGQPVLIAP